MNTPFEGLERTVVALELGRVHYTSGRFFDATETWEQAWREETGSARRLLHGLILAAGAYHKMANHRQPLGMTILLERALEALGPLPDGFGGLQLDRFRAGLGRSLLEARAWLDGGPAPSGPAPLGSAFSTLGDEQASAPGG